MSTITRTAFRTSRLLDFLNRKELVAQTGHQPREWPLVALKELVDNALDACEEQGTSPAIDITVDERGITVADNGPGIPVETVSGIPDFSIRVSSREAYVAPDRGRQGNALKTILAMPFVLDGTEGGIEIDAAGILHKIGLGIDRIRQEPQVDHRQEPGARPAGTLVFLAWPNSPGSTDEVAPEFLQEEEDGEDEVALCPAPADSPWSILSAARARFLQIADDFTWLNPHVSLNCAWGQERTEIAATAPAWRKWLPSNPTDPHWYGVDELERLIAAYIAHDAERGHERTVREFVVGFHGLTGTAKSKKITDSLGLGRARLSDLARGGEIDRVQVAALLKAMQAESRAVKPDALGVIGKDHLAAKFTAVGAEMGSFQYKKVTGATNGLPYVIETAFAWCPAAKGRRIITGVNWSPGIINPFRQLGAYGKSLDAFLEEQRTGPNEPTILVLHMACPRVIYADRGKSSVILES